MLSILILYAVDKSLHCQNVLHQLILILLCTYLLTISSPDNLGCVAVEMLTWQVVVQSINQSVSGFISTAGGSRYIQYTQMKHTWVSFSTPY